MSLSFQNWILSPTDEQKFLSKQDDPGRSLKLPRIWTERGQEGSQTGSISRQAVDEEDDLENFHQKRIGMRHIIVQIRDMAKL